MAVEDSVAQDQIKAFVDRILRLKEEVKAINADIREIYAEAKGSGFDKTVLGKLVNYVEKREADANAVMEGEALFDLYLTAYYGAGTKVATHTHEAVSKPQPTIAAGQVEQRAPVAISSERVAATSSVKNEAAEISTPITEQQEDSDPARDLTASPKLPQGQVAPIQPETANELPPASRGIAGEDDLRELAATVPGQIAQEGDAPLEASANVTGEGMSGHAAHLSTDTENPTRTPAGVVVTDRNGVTGGESAAKDGGQELSVSSAPASAIEFEDSASDAGQAPSTNSQTGKPVEASASAAPLSFADKIKRLRPNCQHPEACRSSGGKAHCGPCGRAAETGSAA